MMGEREVVDYLTIIRRDCDLRIKRSGNTITQYNYFAK